MEKLIDVIRHPTFNPELYSGFMIDDFQFMKVFYLEDNTIEETFNSVNRFLVGNGYAELSLAEFLPEQTITGEKTSVYANPYSNFDTRSLILVIKKFSPHENPIDEILLRLIRFRNERDWEQFHNPKDLALALNVEAGELLELYLWKDANEASIEKVKEELADVFTFSFLLAEKYGLDIKEIILEKIDKNELKYPVDKAKGNAKKYTEL